MMNGAGAFDLADDDYDEIFTNGLSESAIDLAFRKIKKNHTYFLIWRIENLNVVAIQKDSYGTFFDTDSYIIFAASQYGQPSGPNAICRELKTNPEYHIHFWLGTNTTADKAGVAAYKTVELDYYLGGTATQHREVQGNESPRFKSYFAKIGIKILKGGTPSGFNSLTQLIALVPKLYRVQGMRAPIITQMPSVQWIYFNSAYCYILHTDKYIYIWVGRASNKIERLHAVKAAALLSSENNMKNIIFIDDGYEKTMNPDEMKEFSNCLSLSKRQVKPAEDEVDSAESSYKFLKLYRCSEASSKYRVTEVKSGPLKQSDLSSDDVFILDHGVNGIWVWVGRRASEKERMEALRNARGFVKKKKYPSETCVTRVVENKEPFEFKMLFSYWKDEENVGVAKGLAKPVAKVRVTKYDAETMHERPALAAKSQLIDDGSGTVKKWVVRNKNLQDIPKERNAVFFSTDCYIVLYTYKAPNGEKFIIYYWLGLSSNTDDQTSTILKTLEMDYTVGNNVMLSRIVQGREPPHFLQIFRGKMRIFQGKGTDYDPSGKNMKTPSHYLMQVEGNTTFSTKAIQVPLSATSLNSNYCFMLRKASHYYVWCGSYSTGDNREMAKLFAGSDFALILEGSESGDFWYNIGGQDEYTTVKCQKEAKADLPARLFHCTIGKRTFKVEEIFNFTQSDLSPDDILLLDTRNIIYIWAGKNTTKEQRMYMLESATNFINSDPTSRDKNTVIQQVKQGLEPPTFTGFFESWEPNYWDEQRTFDEVRELIETEAGGRSPSVSVIKTQDDDFDDHIKYSISTLTGPKEKLPVSVDPLRKELHLTYDDFYSLTNMSYKEFKNLPLWKQQEIKKKVGLF